MIILIGGEKGGTGKTTIATNLVAMRANKNHDVLLVDTDKQGSSSNWSGIRNAHTNLKQIPCVQKFGSNIAIDIKDLQRRYEDLVIDAGGRDSLELRASMTIADRMYIPIQASQFDVWTLELINELVVQVKCFNPNLSPHIIINRASTNPSVQEASEAVQAVKEFETFQLARCMLKERIAYRKAAKAGLSVTELVELDTKANEEINLLYQEIFYE